LTSSDAAFNASAVVDQHQVVEDKHFLFYLGGQIRIGRLDLTHDVFVGALVDLIQNFGQSFDSAGDLGDGRIFVFHDLFEYPVDFFQHSRVNLVQIGDPDGHVGFEFIGHAR